MITLNPSPIFCFLALCGIWTTFTVEGKKQAHTTQIACEGKFINLSCPEGKLLHITRANYGRFSLNICNDEGVDWANTQCFFAGSVDVMTERCEGRKACTVEASNEAFSDSCPDTPKYLEVQYNCQGKERTTTLPPTIPSTSASATKPSDLPGSEAPDKTTKRAKPAVTTRIAPVIEPEEPVQPPSPVPEKRQFCPQVEVREIVWPRTEIGHNSRQPCPQSLTDRSQFADWHCTGKGEWDTHFGPNLSRCASTWAKDLRVNVTKVDSGQKAIQVARQIREKIRTEPMYGGDNVVTTNALYDLVEKAENQTRNAPAQERQAVARTLGEVVVETSSRMLESETRNSWKDLPRQISIRSANNILDSVEKNAKFILDSSEHEPTITVPSINIFLEVTVVRVQDYVQFPSKSIYDKEMDSVQLPLEAFRPKQTGSSSKLIFASFQNLGEFMPPLPVSRRTKDGSRRDVKREVASNIITATTGSDLPITNLVHPVLITMAIKKNKNHTNPTCVFWDKAAGGSEGVGDWSTQGCKVRKSNDSHVVCECDHLTNFAVLMDVYGVELDYAHIIALSTLTYAGCVISIVCLALSIFAFLIMMIRASNVDRLTIHLNLCICLLIAELVFIFGIPQVGNKMLCGGIAGLLHYFFLASFAWMLLEGIQLYVMLVEVFEAERSRTLWYYLFGYGIPLIIVAISLGVDYNSYGTSTHCWLRTDNYFIMSFVGPVLVVLVLNMAFLTMAVIIMCRHASLSAGYRHCQHRSAPENIALWLRGAVILVVLLGLTWTFGLMYVSKETVVMSYLFTILNSLQGLFIFLFHVLFNDKARKEYRKWVRRNDWLPDCIRDSSLDYYRKPSEGTGGKSSSNSATSPLPLSDSGSTTQSYHTRFLSLTQQEPQFCSSSGQLLPKYGSHEQFREDYAYANYVASECGRDAKSVKSLNRAPKSNSERYFNNPEEYLKLCALNRPPVPSFSPPAPPYYDVAMLRRPPYPEYRGHPEEQFEPDYPNNSTSIKHERIPELDFESIPHLHEPHYPYPGYERTNRQSFGAGVPVSSAEPSHRGLDDSAYSESTGSSRSACGSAGYPAPIKVTQVSPGGGVRNSNSRCTSGGSSSSVDFIIRDAASSPEASSHSPNGLHSPSGGGGKGLLGLYLGSPIREEDEISSPQLPCSPVDSGRPPSLPPRARSKVSDFNPSHFVPKPKLTTQL